MGKNQLLTPSCSNRDNLKLFQSPNPHKQDSKAIPQQMLITTYIVLHTGTISVPEEQCQEALQPRFLT